MTQYAKRHDGQVLEFPDETTPEDMDRAVKKSLGIPVPPTPEEAVRGEDVALAGQRNQSILMLAQQMASLNLAVKKLCDDQYKTQALLQQVVGGVGQLTKMIGAAASRIEQAVLAPQVMTMDRDDKGRIKETKIEKVRG